MAGDWVGACARSDALGHAMDIMTAARSEARRSCRTQRFINIFPHGAPTNSRGVYGCIYRIRHSQWTGGSGVITDRPCTEAARTGRCRSQVMAEGSTEVGRSSGARPRQLRGRHGGRQYREGSGIRGGGQVEAGGRECVETGALEMAQYTVVVLQHARRMNMRNAEYLAGTQTQQQDGDQQRMLSPSAKKLVGQCAH